MYAFLKCDSVLEFPSAITCFDQSGPLVILITTLKTSNKDINYIKTSTILTNKDEKTQNLNLLYILFFLPLILILILKIKSFFFKDTDLNILDRRHKVANRVANKRLKNAHECIKNENFDLPPINSYQVT